MTRAFRVLLIAGLLGLLGISSAAAQTSGLTTADILRIAQSVVLVVAFEDEDPIASGSGTIVDPSGYIFTNYHVIEDADDTLIFMLDDPAEQPELRYVASIVAGFEELDLAVLRIDRDEDGNPLDRASLNLPFIPPAAPDIGFGEGIYVFGYPGITDGYLSVTQGTITTIENGTISGERLPLWYRTDAEASPGNSGGLAVNIAGQMVGIPTQVVSEELTGGRNVRILSSKAILAAVNLDDLANNPEPDIQTDSAPRQPSGGDGLDYGLSPKFGEVALEAGFLPDPFTADVISGGEVDVADVDLGDACVGFATDQPSYRLQWTGDSRALRIFFVGDGDATLIINDADGDWHCADDSFETLHPTIDLNNPPEGQYDIWVGTFESGEDTRGTLYITERNLTPADVE